MGSHECPWAYMTAHGILWHIPWDPVRMTNDVHRWLPRKLPPLPWKKNKRTKCFHGSNWKSMEASSLHEGGNVHRSFRPGTFHELPNLPQPSNLTPNSNPSSITLSRVHGSSIIAASMEVVSTSMEVFWTSTEASMDASISLHLLP